MGKGTLIERAWARDHLVVAAILGTVTVLAWAWTLSHAGMAAASGGMNGMGSAVASAALAPAVWSLSHAALIFLMWWVMMVAMMLPSAAPVALLATSIYRRTAGQGRPALLACILAGGYVSVWGAFSLGAATVQWALHMTGLLVATTMSVGPALGGSILLAAGTYQISPVKRACLRRCRSPAEFLSTHWRPGILGAFRLGTIHGAYCLGCCWVLMGLLFVGGVMNPLWIGGIALYVLIEKFARRGEGLSRLTAFTMLSAGMFTLLVAVR